MIASLVVAGILALLLVHATLSYVKLHHETRFKGVFRPFPVPETKLEDVHPVFKLTKFGPSLETQVFFLGRAGMNVEGGTSDAEAWVLSVLARTARSMFEFGTCTGKTTYLWAMNSSPSAKVVTLTLKPEESERQSVHDSDDLSSVKKAISESRFDDFIYSGTPCESKITQLYGDSKRFDETAYRESFDLVFVDGNHSYSYVKSDSEKGMAMLKPGGRIIWHDYRGPFSETRDTYRYLSELNRTLPLRHIEGTSLVVYEKPVSN